MSPWPVRIATTVSSLPISGCSFWRARATVALMPNAEHEMNEDAGHLPWLDAPQLIGTKTASFLAG